MVRFVIEKFISGILTLFGVATVVFFLIQCTSGRSSSDGFRSKRYRTTAFKG